MIRSAIAVTALVLSTGFAFADQPDGTFQYKDNNTYDQKNNVGQASSQIIQNGQFVGGNHGAEAYDQTTTPGSRAEAVQALQAQQGRGRVNSQK